MLEQSLREIDVQVQDMQRQVIITQISMIVRRATITLERCFAVKKGVALLPAYMNLYCGLRKQAEVKGYDGNFQGYSQSELNILFRLIDLFFAIESEYSQSRFLYDYFHTKAGDQTILNALAYDHFDKEVYEQINQYFYEYVSKHGLFDYNRHLSNKFVMTHINEIRENGYTPELAYKVHIYVIDNLEYLSNT